MTTKTIILDFDGTLTEVEKEAVPYVISYKKDLPKLLSLTEQDFEKEWKEAKDQIQQKPDEYGWKSDNKIVAPALADPYILCQTIANIIMDRFSIFLDPASRLETLDRLYKENYTKCDIVFREKAKDFLIRLSDNFSVFIVTNSRTDAVTHKLNMLLSKPLSITVIGNAKKYVLAQDFTEIPESISLNGISRPIYLRRKYYHQVIQEILHSKDVSPESLLVFGDIFELDLALPLYLKAHIGLITKNSTLAYEKKAVVENSGFVVDNLESALKNILSRK